MSLDSDIEILKRVGLFEGFASEHLRLIAFGAEPLDVAAGTELFHVGAYADGGYVVVEGLIDLFAEKDGAIIGTYGKGSLIGEMALITETARASRAVARMQSRVMKVPRMLFRRMLEEYPDLASVLRERIAQSVQSFVDQLDTVRQRIDRVDER